MPFEDFIVLETAFLQHKLDQGKKEVDIAELLEFRRCFFNIGKSRVVEDLLVTLDHSCHSLIDSEGDRSRYNLAMQSLRKYLLSSNRIKS